MKPLLVSSGEPAGVGPDLCLALAACELPVVILGDLSLLKARAKLLNLSIQFEVYSLKSKITPGKLSVLPIACTVPVQVGELNPKNASYVIDLLTLGAKYCLEGTFSALVTAPVHKANINAAGIKFTGHTEFFAEYFGLKRVVMLLVCKEMRVALVTTHLPLSAVPENISIDRIVEIISILNQSLVNDFGIINPKIKVAGLNPHAGESGYLGQEEIKVIEPALRILQAQGINVEGPLPADTMFTQTNCDAFVAMYHDQGLSVLKYASFNRAVNVTLGLPIVRTSVDHGTALDLAGKGKVDSGSLLAAVHLAMDIAQTREMKCP